MESQHLSGKEHSKSNAVANDVSEQANATKRFRAPSYFSAGDPDIPIISNRSDAVQGMFNAGAVVQRTPEQAIKQVLANFPDNEDIMIRRGRRILNNSLGFVNAPYALGDDVFNKLKRDVVVAMADASGLTSQESIEYITAHIQPIWNAGTPVAKRLSGDDIRLPLSDEGAEAEEIAFQQELEQQQALEEQAALAAEEAADPLDAWYSKNISEKTMTPGSKLGKMMKHDALGGATLLASDLPEDFWVAMKMFFVHTAGFNPLNNQGRDINDVESEMYYRSEENPVKEHFKNVTKSALVPDRLAAHQAQGRTFRPFNPNLSATLNQQQITTQNLRGARAFDTSGTGQVRTTIFPYQHTDKVGPLGLLSNAVKTTRETVRVQRGPTGLPETTETGNETDELQQLIAQETLQLSDPNSNYHDLMLRDRGALITAVSNWINADPGLISIHLYAIQAPGHPSLVIEYADGGVEGAWRTTFTNEFNAAAAGAGFDTVLSKRSSFGFLFPTISSVAGPVRIWPGMLPNQVFFNIIKQTLRRIHADSEEEHKLVINIDAPAPAGSMLHLDTLKTAVRHTCDVLANAAARPLNDSMYDWLITRLRRNLNKARYLLSHIPGAPVEADGADDHDVAIDLPQPGPPGGDIVMPAEHVNSDAQMEIPEPNALVPIVPEADPLPLAELAAPEPDPLLAEEHHFQKSALVVESLMEYSQLLIAMTREASAEEAHPQADTFAQTARAALFNVEDEDGDLSVYLLDSGMQAIVAANLLAKQWTAAAQGAEQAAANRKLIDVNSYFEYLKITGNANLGLDEFVAPEAAADEEVVPEAPGPGLEALLPEAIVPEEEPAPAAAPALSPDLISADLNPVITSKEKRDNMTNAADVLGQYAGRQAQKRIVPIIDITNSTVADAAALQLRQGYTNFILVESLSKHQQLGNDKYTMGRLVIAGDADFLAMAQVVIGPIEVSADDPLWRAYSNTMDRVFYGPQPHAAV